MDTLAEKLITKALDLGASVAGLAGMGDLCSYSTHNGYPITRAAGEQDSVLVLGLDHPPLRPELDWFIGRGGTEGNRTLMRINAVLSSWLHENYGIGSRDLHYYAERGGVFLKEAAVLAGLGGEGFPVTGQAFRGRIQVFTDFVEEEPVEAVETGLLQPTLGEVGTQHGRELGLVQNIHPGQLGQAVQGLGRGDAQPGRPGRSRKPEDHRFHFLIAPLSNRIAGSLRSQVNPRLKTVFRFWLLYFPLSRAEHRRGGRDKARGLSESADRRASFRALRPHRRRAGRSGTRASSFGYFSATRKKSNL